MLVLDDLHWADAPTLALLRHLARATADAPLLMLASAREVAAETAPDLADALADVHRLDGVTRLRLGGLAPPEIAEFLRRLAPRADEGRLAELADGLADVTGGNAFLMAEVGHHLADAGLLDDDAAPTGALEGMGVPQGVRDVAAQRLARMSADSRDLIELAAVGDRAVEFVVMRAAAPLDEPALLRALDEATSSRMLEEMPGTLIAYRFRHELLRRAVSDRLPAARRAALHLRLAAALEAVRGAEDDRSVSELALHFGQAAALGGAERAIHYALRAAELAARSFAFEEAARQLRSALDLGIPDPATRARTLCHLGDALHRVGSAPEALESYAAAAADARALEDHELLAEAAIGFENACWRPGIGAAESIALVEEAIAATGTREAPLRVRLLAGLSRARAYRGDHDLAAEIWREAVEMARRIGDRLGLAVTLFHAAWTRGSQSASDVLISLDEARELFTALGETDLRNELDGFRLTILLEAYETETLRRDLASFGAVVERVGQPFYLHVFTYVSSTLALCDGRLADAEALANEAFELSRHFDEDASALHGIQMFTVQRERGRLAQVAPLVRLIAARPPEERGVWGPALALLMAELGMADEAQSELRRLCADDFATMPRGGLWLGGLAYLADTCVLVDDATLAGVLYAELARLEGRNVVIGQAVACYGAADRFLGMLATTLGDLDGAARHFEAALELNARLGSPTWLAHTQYAYGRALARRARGADLARADELLGAALATAARHRHGGARRARGRGRHPPRCCPTTCRRARCRCSSWSRTGVRTARSATRCRSASTPPPTTSAASSSRRAARTARRPRPTRTGAGSCSADRVGICSPDHAALCHRTPLRRRAGSDRGGRAQCRRDQRGGGGELGGLVPHRRQAALLLPLRGVLV